jgi:hypothetical protein
MVSGTAQAAHQLMPGGMEFDFVDAVAETVMAAQFRPVTVRQAGQGLDMRRADQRAAGFQLVLGPGRAVEFQRILQGHIAGEGVVAGEIPGLVAHLMRGVGGAFCGGVVHLTLS